MDSLNLYEGFCLNKEIFGISLNRGIYKSVSLNNIKSFQLLTNPDPKWEKAYNDVRSEAKKLGDYDCGVSWRDPWFHIEIKKTRKEIDQLNYSIYK
jgi:hypothetical protein